MRDVTVSQEEVSRFKGRLEAAAQKLSGDREMRLERKQERMPSALVVFLSMLVDAVEQEGGRL